MHLRTVAIVLGHLGVTLGWREIDRLSVLLDGQVVLPPNEAFIAAFLGTVGLLGLLCGGLIGPWC